MNDDAVDIISVTTQSEGVQIMVMPSNMSPRDAGRLATEVIRRLRAEGTIKWYDHETALLQLGFKRVCVTHHIPER